MIMVSFLNKSMNEGGRMVYYWCDQGWHELAGNRENYTDLEIIP